MQRTAKYSKYSKYSDTELEDITRQFMDDIIELRNRANVIQVSTEATYLADAEALCSVGIAGNDVSAFLSMQEEKDRVSQENWFDANWWKVVVVFMPIVLLILGYVVIRSSA